MAGQLDWARSQAPIGQLSLGGIGNQGKLRAGPVVVQLTGIQRARYIHDRMVSAASSSSIRFPQNIGAIAW